MNNCTFIGHIGGNLELKKAGDVSVLNFSLAVRRRFVKDGQPDTDWLRMVCFGKTAEFIAKYFQKGSEIALVTHVQTGSYEKEGVTHYTTDFVVDQASFTGGSKSESSASTTSTKTPDPVVDTESDLPF